MFKTTDKFGSTRLDVFARMLNILENGLVRKIIDEKHDIEDCKLGKIFWEVVNGRLFLFVVIIKHGKGNIYHHVDMPCKYLDTKLEILQLLMESAAIVFDEFVKRDLAILVKLEKQADTLNEYYDNSDKLHELWAAGQEDSEDYKILLNKSFELWAGLSPEQKQNLNFPFHHE